MTSMPATNTVQSCPPCPAFECDIHSAEEKSSSLCHPDLESDEIEYPEGGLRAWLVVLGSFCGM